MLVICSPEIRRKGVIVATGSKWAVLAGAVVALIYGVIQGNEAAIGAAVLAIVNFFVHPPVDVTKLVSK